MLTNNDYSEIRIIDDNAIEETNRVSDREINAVGNFSFRFYCLKDMMNEL